MNIINGAYYQLIDSRVAHIRGISGYHPEDIVFTEIYDSKGKLLEFKDYWVSTFKSLICKRVQPCNKKT